MTKLQNNENSDPSSKQPEDGKITHPGSRPISSKLKISNDYSKKPPSLEEILTDPSPVCILKFNSLREIAKLSVTNRSIHNTLEGNFKLSWPEFSSIYKLHFLQLIPTDLSRFISDQKENNKISPKGIKEYKYLFQTGFWRLSKDLKKHQYVYEDFKPLWLAEYTIPKDSKEISADYALASILEKIRTHQLLNAIQKEGGWDSYVKKNFPALLKSPYYAREPYPHGIFADPEVRSSIARSRVLQIIISYLQKLVWRGHSTAQGLQTYFFDYYQHSLDPHQTLKGQITGTMQFPHIEHSKETALLYCAFQCFRHEFITDLIKDGLNIHTSTVDYQRQPIPLLAWVCLLDNFTSAAFLIEKKAEINFGVVKSVILFGSLPMVQFLVEKCGKSRICGFQGKKSGHTLLHVAAVKNSSIAHYLLETKIDPNQRDKVGNTALHFASHYPELVKILVEKHHVAINSESEEKITPLHYFTHAFLECDVEEKRKKIASSMQHLLIYGADRHKAQELANTSREPHAQEACKLLQQAYPKPT